MRSMRFARMNIIEFIYIRISNQKKANFFCTPPNIYIRLQELSILVRTAALRIAVNIPLVY